MRAGRCCCCCPSVSLTYDLIRRGVTRGGAAAHYTCTDQGKFLEADNDFREIFDFDSVDCTFSTRHVKCVLHSVRCTAPPPGTPLAAHTLQAAGVCPLHFLACGQQLTGVMSPLLTNIYICKGELDTAQLYSSQLPAVISRGNVSPPGCSLDQVSDAAH